MKTFVGLLLLFELYSCQFGLTEHGALGQTCFGDGTCDYGLVCVKGKCHKLQASVDAGTDAELDGGKPDSNRDVKDAGVDADLADEGTDGGVDAGADVGPDAGAEAGIDGGAVDGCAPNCARKECGDDGCGHSCGTCNSPPTDHCLNETTLVNYDIDGICEDGRCSYSPQFLSCSNGCANAACLNCTLQCAGKCGGADGCGGVCPDNCVAPQTCGGGGTRYVCGCTPDCGDKCSGYDGCWGECPDNCILPQTCSGGGVWNVCGCTINCLGKCGDVSDGCGGVCPPGCAWTDPVFGLTWQNPPPEAEIHWQEAEDYCKDLVLVGYSDWHLPTINELRSLIRGCPNSEPGGACGVTDTCTTGDAGCTTNCFACGGNYCHWPDEMEGPCEAGDVIYWSSTLLGSTPTAAWCVYFGGLVNYTALTFSYHLSYQRVRCVRGELP